MRETINEEVSVNLVYDSKKKEARPRHVRWQGQLYTVAKIGLHHTYREGRTLIHVFSVDVGDLFLRLELNTDDLHWRLREVSDGLPE